MPSVEINGGRVVYEVLGDPGGIPIALTPGGRAAKDSPISLPLAQRLAAGGMRVLVWDRPNSGESDIQFSDRWPSESHLGADTLQQLIKHLGWGPTVLAGGSSGSRLSVVTAIEYPEVTAKLFVWHLVGGIYPSLSLACGYILGNIAAARRGGMEAVIDLPEWKQRIEQNPGNRERFLAIGREEFIRVMKLWLNAYVPKPGQVIPGVPDEDIARINAPTTIIRSGEDDEEHPLLTSYEVHALIKGSRLAEPPWAEDAWDQAFARSLQTGGPQAFDRWADAAPLIIDFSRAGAAAP